MLVKHYALSGFACNGKSTLVKLAKGFVPSDYLVMTSPSVARHARSIFHNFNFPFDQQVFEQSILTAETAVFKFINQIKDNLWFLLSKKVKGLVILQERSIFDVLSFMIAREYISLTQAVNYLYEFFKELSDTCLYDKLFIVKPIEDYEFIEKRCVVDIMRGIRDVHNFLALQDKFYKALNKLISALNGSDNTNNQIKVAEEIIHLEHPYLNSCTPLSFISAIREDLVSNNFVSKVLEDFNSHNLNEGAI